MALRTWTVKADKGQGLTCRELIETLELAPPNSQPKVVVSLGGLIKSVTIQTNRQENEK